MLRTTSATGIKKTSTTKNLRHENLDSNYNDLGMRFNVFVIYQAVVIFKTGKFDTQSDSSEQCFFKVWFEEPLSNYERPD